MGYRLEEPQQERRGVPQIELRRQHHCWGVLMKDGVGVGVGVVAFPPKERADGFVIAPKWGGPVGSKHGYLLRCE